MYSHVIEMSIFQECPQATVVVEYNLPALVINSDRSYYLQATTNVQRVHSVSSRHSASLLGVLME